MLVELSILPIGDDSHISEDIAEVLSMVRSSGLPHQLTPLGTLIEGSWDDVMPLLRRCHDRVRERAAHVVTQIRIDDQQGETNLLSRNVDSVEEKLAHSLGRT